MIYEEYEKRLNKYRREETRLRKKYSLISNIRLFVFLAIIALFMYIQFTELKNSSYLVALVGFVFFVFLVVEHKKINSHLTKVRNLIIINQKSLERISGSWHNFEDKGMEFIDKEHPYTSDLDIFGYNSLFQCYNTANTYTGRTMFAQSLSYTQKDKGLIKKRQNAIKELAEKVDFCQKLEAESMLHEDVKNNPRSLISYASSNDKVFENKNRYRIAVIFPLILLVALVGKFLGFQISWLVPLVIVLLQCFIFLAGIKRISMRLNELGEFKDKVNVFSKMIEVIEKEKFYDSYLSELRDQLYINSIRASDALKKLGRISDFADLRYDTLFYFLFNIFLLWDYHVLYALEQWKLEYGKSLKEWISCIGRFEELCSLSLIKQLNREWCFPNITNEKNVISAKDLGHPLIHSNVRVGNSIRIDNNICIVTGSNMSGKTTLLRTIGINLVLAYAGAPVCANNMACSVMNIYTSMRINDDLSSGTSTFYAELLRIKKIIDASNKKESMIFLIDEIFRGTNSKDRLLGAKSVLKNLNKSWVTGLISTHDLELCDMDKEIGSRVKNYYFSEHYKNNEILFDYKLRAGKSDTTNAVYLMKMIGIDI